MKSRLLSMLLETLRMGLRSLVLGWSLERKSLLFLGFALLFPIGLAFWFVLEMVAEPLVKRTTRQAARDYARSVIAWRHVDRRTAGGVKPVFPDDNSYFFPDQLAILRKDLVDNSDYRYEFLMLDEVVQHEDLGNAELPASAHEEQLLRDLESRFRAREEERLARKQRAAEESIAAQSDPLAPASGGTSSPPRAPLVASPASGRSTNLESSAGAGTSVVPSAGPQPAAAIPPGADTAGLAAPASDPEYLYKEDGPITAASASQLRFVEDTPAEGWYVYYHAVDFPASCLNCHQRYKTAAAPEVPFRVVKVLLPYQQLQVASTTTLALLITVAMVTIASTLLVVHWVLRRLVLYPLQHLRTVSDEISRGNTNLRANIDTGDEFNELGDAFNRMLRHMTEGQDKLQKLNYALDLKVDELAQANLHLFEANRLKSDFLANMSHELRTPLNSIIGFSDVLHDITALTDKQRRYAANIQKSGKLLLAMINDILDLAKVEAGKMEVTPSSFDLGHLVSAQCDMLRSLLDEKNMDLQIESAGDVQEVFQDQPKLQQILTNLLSNAIKFTPDGGLVVISMGRVSERFFHITITDTGVGIPEADFEIIFEKFRQSSAVLENDGLTRQHSGTGLGLSIVKELCKLLGGEVRLTSQLGTGSTFQVVLPIHYDQPRTHAATES